MGWREGEKEREERLERKTDRLPPIPHPGLIHNLGMCPEWKLKWKPFGACDSTSNQLSHTSQDYMKNFEGSIERFLNRKSSRQIIIIGGTF